MEKNKVLVVRLGAFGDMLITTPLIRHLSNSGFEIFLLTSDQGQIIYENNPHIKKIIVHKKDSIPNKHLRTYFDSIAQAYECEKIIDLCESIEVNLSVYPTSPKFCYPKNELMKICNKNFYEETFRKANININRSPGLYLPELFFTPYEEKQMQKFFDKLHNKFVIVWGISGSMRCKTYPYASEIIGELIENEKIAVITVGDELCQALEVNLKHPQIINKSGIWSMRESMLACKYANLVISPDTGLLHASGCFKTPKIGLLTH
jgi:ADP-heptose:LPS heptosyltransferase